VTPRIEPLTPIDQPLDKLDDLTLRERSVHVLFSSYSIARMADTGFSH
jgi:hypothetical protein